MSTLLDSQVEALGWTLLHSLWQGALLWMILEAALAWPGARSPRTRGRLAGGALLLFVLAVAGTYGWVGRNDGSVAERRARMVEKAPAVIVAGPAVDAGATAGAVADSRGETPAGAEGGDGAPPSKTAGWRERVRPALPWMVGVWGAGVVVGLGRHAREWALLRRLRRAPRAELSPEWRERFAALCARCAPGLRLPRIGETALVRVPQVVGGWAPVILLPAGFLAGLPTAQTEAVLAHELAHLVRRDFWLNALQSLAEALFFFHPAVHAINGHIRRERERACDDLAVEWTGDSLGYARALAALAGAVPASPTAASCVLAADGHEPGELRSRIERLLGRPVAGRMNWAPGGLLVLGVVAAYAALFAASPVIVAQVMSPEERVKVVQEAVAETLPRDSGTTLVKPYPEGEILVVSELRTEDGSAVPDEVWGEVATKNGPTGSGGNFWWSGGRAERRIRLGTVQVMAVPVDWAPVAIYDLKPESGAKELRVPPITLRKGRSLRVRLGTPAGEPLAGLEVRAMLSPRNAPRFQHWVSKPWVTDAEGAFVIPQADPDFRYEFSVEAKGRQNTRREVMGFKDGETVVWVLPVSRPITGRVVDRGNGAPVPGASVHLAGGKGSDAARSQDFKEAPLATTDSDGRFELPGWDDAGTYALRIAHPDYASTLMAARAGERVEIELAPGGFRVSGRLRLTKAEARENLERSGLSITRWVDMGQGSSIGAGLAPCALTRVTDDEYRFEAGNLPAGRASFSAVATSSFATFELGGDREGLALEMDGRRMRFAEGSPEALALREAGPKVYSPEAHAGPKRAVTLAVRASDGGRVSDRQLLYYVEVRDQRGGVGTAVWLKSGESALPEMPVGARVHISSWDGPMDAGHWIPPVSFEVPAGDGTHLHEIPAYPAGAIVVEVLEHDGLTLAGGRLFLEGEDPERGKATRDRFAPFSAGVAEQSGRATFPCVPLGGRYRVVATEGSRVTRSDWIILDAANPRRDVRLRFSEGAALRGRIRLPDGSAAAGVEVSLAYRPEVFAYASPLEKVRTDDVGECLFSKLSKDGDVRYQVMVEPRRDWQPMLALVSAARETDWSFTLQRGHRLSGRVVDAAGAPVAGVEVVATLGMDQDYRGPLPVSQMRAEAPTDAEGRFQFSNLQPGMLRFRADDRRVQGEGAKLRIPADTGVEFVITVE